jgi:hypothetical protein
MTSKQHSLRKSRLEKMHELYRKSLKRPDLSADEIETMRKHMILVAQTICEHVWGKKYN